MKHKINKTIVKLTNKKSNPKIIKNHQNGISTVKTQKYEKIKIKN